MKFRATIILVFLGIILSNTTTYGAVDSIAFGYITNTSKDKSYDYLETVLPHSIASSLKNSSNISITHTGKSIDKLREHNTELKKLLTPQEAQETARKIGSNFFLYGYFSPVGKNEIRITINLYSNKTGNFFTFAQIEILRAEITPLLDKITSTLINFVSGNEIYMANRIQKKAGIGFITDLSPTEMNEFYLPFLKTDYRMMHIQNNSIETNINYKNIDAFYYITTEKSSYNNISSLEEATNADLSFLKQKKATLRLLEESCGGNLDYIIIIGFNRSKKSAWLRGINARTQALMWIQPEIKGNSIQDICNEIIIRMRKEPQNLLK